MNREILRRPLRLLCLSACLGILPSCRLDNSSPREEKFVTVRLNDSLSRFNSVKVLILANGDTSQVVGTAWDGALAAPGSIPSYRIEDGETRTLSIRVMGFDQYGRLALDMLITKDGDRQAVTVLPLPLPRPSPALASLQLSAGALVPPFDPAVKEYAVALTNSQSSFTVTLAPAYASAAMLVGVAWVSAAQASDPIFAQVGENHFTINVTAADTATQYYLTVTRAVPAVGDSGKGSDDSNHTQKPDPNEVYRLNWGHAALVNVNFILAGIFSRAMVTDFPLLLRLTPGNFKLADAAAGGRDLRFVTADGRALPYEISRWDPQLGEGDVWIKTDTLISQWGSSPILMYWGNGAAAAASDPAAVFPARADWTAVWHLEETGNGIAGEFKDATGKFNASAAGGGKRIPTRKKVTAGYGQDFNAADMQTALVVPPEFDPGSQAWTLQMWVKRIGKEPCVLFNKGDGLLPINLRARLSIFLGKVFSLWGDGSEYVSKSKSSVSLTQCVAVVYDGSKADLYVDGFLRESTPWKQGQSATAQTVIGALDENGALGLHGMLDEVWVSSTARSETFMRLIYYNQKPGSTLVTLLPL